MTKSQKNIIFIQYSILNNNEFFAIYKIIFSLWKATYKPNFTVDSQSNFNWYINRDAWIDNKIINRSRIFE